MADRRATAEALYRGLVDRTQTGKQVIEQTLVVVVRIARCTPHHALATPPAGG